ncbi:MAG: hypothetical protein MJ252_26925, partial [archaeon]|nr:hypothetical protein [archaeon]
MWNLIPGIVTTIFTKVTSNNSQNEEENPNYKRRRVTEELIESVAMEDTEQSKFDVNKFLL